LGTRQAVSMSIAVFPAVFLCALAEGLVDALMRTAENAQRLAVSYTLLALLAHLLARQAHGDDLGYARRRQDDNAVIVGEDDVARMHDEPPALYGDVQLAGEAWRTGGERRDAPAEHRKVQVLDF